jgi:chorismate mutase
VAEGVTIDELRARIDALDEELVRLLNLRVACAVEVGRLKHEAGLAVYQPEREAHVLSSVRRSAAQLAGPLTAEAVVRIFERIIDEARRAERRREAETGAAPGAAERATHDATPPSNEPGS